MLGRPAGGLRAEVALHLGEAALEELEPSAELGPGVLPALRELGARHLATTRQLAAGLLAPSGQLAAGLVAAAGELVDQLARPLACRGRRAGGGLEGALDRVAKRVSDAPLARLVTVLFRALAQAWEA